MFLPGQEAEAAARERISISIWASLKEDTSLDASNSANATEDFEEGEQQLPVEIASDEVSTAAAQSPRKKSDEYSPLIK